MTAFSLVLALTVSFDSCQTLKRVLFTFANSSKLVKTTPLHIAFLTLSSVFGNVAKRAQNMVFQIERQKANHRAPCRF